MIIKKGRKGIWKFPKFLKARDTFTKYITITEDMFLVDDSCDSGWSKLTGIIFGWVHWNSYRLVFRVVNGELILGYYVYQKGVSPQKNKDFKGIYSFDNIKVDDVFRLKIKFTDVIAMELEKYGGDSHSVTFNREIGFGFPRVEARPNIKCKAVKDLHFKIK